jgi:membrane protein
LSGADAVRTAVPPAPDAGPASPMQLTRGSLWQAVKQTGIEFNGDNAWDWAAALTYYAVLSVFPGLLVLVSVVGLLSESAAQSLIASLNEVAPGPVRTIITASVTGLQESSGIAGVVAVIGLLVALWSASGYAGAFMRAANALYDVPEGRPLWKTLPIRLGITVGTGLLLVTSATIVILSGTLATVVGRALGLETATVGTWNLVKWPILVILIAVLFALLYRASPNARQGGLRWITPGGLIAVLLWMMASFGFGVYATNFASYDKTYGTLAGVVVFLVWLWISNLALLFGLKFNAELERQRAIAAGLPPQAEPYLRLRDGRAVSDGPSQRLADRAWIEEPTVAPRQAAPTRPVVGGATPGSAPAGAGPQRTQITGRTAAFAVGAVLGGLVVLAGRRRAGFGASTVDRDSRPVRRTSG